jgi:pyruvate kinase
MMRSFLRHAQGRACAQHLRTIGTLRLNQMPVTGANTKIVCTIGPASDQAESLGQLVTYGMSVARLNFSHAGDDYTYSEANMALLRNAVGKHHHLATGSSTDLPKNLRAILVDTKGPEIRTGILPGDVEIMDIPVGATVMLCI